MLSPFSLNVVLGFLPMHVRARLALLRIDDVVFAPEVIQMPCEGLVEYGFQPGLTALFGNVLNEGVGIPRYFFTTRSIVDVTADLSSYLLRASCKTYSIFYKPKFRFSTESDLIVTTDSTMMDAALSFIVASNFHEEGFLCWTFDGKVFHCDDVAATLALEDVFLYEMNKW